MKRRRRRISGSEAVAGFTWNIASVIASGIDPAPMVSRGTAGPGDDRAAGRDNSMKLIILDRDGVLNVDSDAFVKSPDEWLPIPGSLEAVARLNHAGYRVVVATNQSGIGRGLFDLETLNLIHRKMHRMVQEAGGLIEAVFFCPDVDEANPYRKPNPGMLLEIGRRLKCGLQGVPVVGDSVRDIRAARAANARPLLVLTGKGAQTLEREAESCANVQAFKDLAAVADYLTARNE